MDIVFIAHFAGSPRHGMVYGHYYLAREWARQGHRVTIVAASHSHTRLEQPATSGRLTEEVIDGIRYLWVSTPAYTPADRLGRVRNILSFVAHLWWGQLPLAHADIVICSSHHPFAIHPARRLSQRWGARLVFEVRDLWPLTLIELGGATKRNLFIRAMQFSEDYAYRHADRVVSVLVASADYMVEHGMAREKFMYVPNGVMHDAASGDEPLPSAHIEALNLARSMGGFLIGYAGRIGLANALDILITALARCADANVYLAILGDGSHVAALRAQAAELGLEDRVIFLRAVSKTQVHDFLRRMDAVYIGLRSHPLFRFGVSPTKLNDYMLAGKPVISAIDAPGDIVAESGAGVSCHPDRIDDISNAILMLSKMSTESLAGMGALGQRWIVANRDYRVLADRFLQHVSRGNPPTGRWSNAQDPPFESACAGPKGA